MTRFDLATQWEETERDLVTRTAELKHARDYIAELQKLGHDSGVVVAKMSFQIELMKREMGLDQDTPDSVVVQYLKLLVQIQRANKR